MNALILEQSLMNSDIELSTEKWWRTFPSLLDKLSLYNLRVTQEYVWNSLLL